MSQITEKENERQRHKEEKIFNRTEKLLKKDTEGKVFYCNIQSVLHY